MTTRSARPRRNGLAIGDPAPGFCLDVVGAGEIALEELRGRHVLLVFSDPGCPPCQALAPELEALSRERADVQILVVSRGTEEANRIKVAEHGVTYPVALQQRWETSRAYGAFILPSAYLIDEDGLIASVVARGYDAILDLVRSPSTAESIASS